MTPDDFQGELDKQDADKQKQQDKQDEISAINKAGIKNVEATNANTESTKKTLQDGSAKVAVTNPDLAKTSDVAATTDAINKMNLTAFMTNDGLPKLAQGLLDFTQQIKELSGQYKDQGFTKLSAQLEAAVKALNTVAGKLSDTKIKVDLPLQKTIDGLQKSIDAIDFKPTVNVAAPEAKVVTTPIDLKPLLTGLAKVEKAVTDSKPDNEDIDLSPVITGLSDVQNAIQALRFPVANYVLPFKDSNGKDVQVQLDSSGNVPTSGGGSGGGGTQYAEGNTTAPATGNVSLGRYQTSAPTLTNGQLYGLQLDSSGNLKVSGSLTVGGTVDEASFTAGTSTFNPSGGVFNDSVAALTSGQQGTQRLTANRAVHMNLRNVAGTEIATASNPLRIDPTGGTTQPVSEATLDAAISTTGSTLPGNFIAIGMSDGTNLRAVRSNLGDGVASNTLLDSSNYIFNASTYDRTRSVTNATNSTGTGITATGILAQFDDVTPTSITENQFGNVRMSANRNLYSTIRDAAGNERGANVTAAGALVVDGSSTTQPVSGTVTSNQGTAAAVGSGWPIIGGELADTTGTFTNATQTTSVTSGSFDGYSTVILSINGTYGTATAVFEVSDDGGTTWYSVNAARSDGSAVETGYTSLSNTNRMWVLNASGADEFRVRSTAVASGTVNVRISIESMTTSEATSVSIPGTVAVTQSTSPWVINTASATGSAVPANAFYTAMINTTSNLMGLHSYGFGQGTSRENVLGAGIYVDNGTTADRVTGATNALNSTGTGLLNANNVAQFDDVSPTSITENQFGNLRISANRNLYGTIRDAAGNERGANVTAGNALTVDASATTQPISASSLPLPTGAATSVNQSTEITSLATLVTSTHAEDAASASGDIGVFTLGVRNDTVADTTNANGDYTQFSTDVKGHTLTANAPRLLKVQQTTTITASTAETTILTAVASTFLDVYGVIVANTSATAEQVTFKDATAGTTRFVLEIPAGDTRGFMLPIDAAHNQAAVNNNWTATCGTSLTSIFITMLAVKNI